MSRFRYETNIGIRQDVMVCSGSEGNSKVEMMRASRNYEEMQADEIWGALETA